MIHSTPWALIFLIFVINDLLHFIVFTFTVHVIISVHIQNLIQASCSLMTTSSPSTHLFSHLFIAPLGDFRPWPLFSSLDAMAHYFSNTFFLPPVAFCQFTTLLSIFSVLAGV